MSLKDLFGKTSEKIVANKQLQDLYKEIESEGLVEEIVTDRERFLPPVDFSSASNFARYGSAERYYVDAITNIYENYPYDGSKKEKLEWRNKSSQLDLYIFDSIYPKTTGYINLGSGSAGSYVTGSSTYRYSVYPQYVSLKGGPNASQTGKFEDANLYDLSLNRESNLGITSLGNTVEFWFKDNVSTSSAATNYVFCLFDMWNGVASGSSDYTRLTIEHSSSNKFLLTYVSGTKGIVRQELTFTGSLVDWHHYGFTFKNNDATTANLDVSFYVDGNLYSTETLINRGDINLANNRNLKANIGAYLANHSGSNTSIWEGLGNSYGSYDEFRFWKAARTSKEIYRNWFTQTGGGANTDDSNVNLGVYCKFNEGIVSTGSVNSLDAVCLDSSGRVSNGTISNYALNVRNTGSAIDVYFGEQLEEKDPIIFSSNPAVSDIIDYYTEIGADYDKDNNANILYSLPSWILDESGTDKNDLTSLVQIIASYFDTLHNQINELPKIKNTDYTQQGNKPKPFTNKLLTSAGFDNLEIFNDINFLEEMLSRNEGEVFEDKLHNIKNVIYQNIYNNLAYIYKTKGTEKSLRNLIRCFGVDDELVKINLYANNAEYELSDKYNYSSVTKKFLDLNDADRYDGFVVQKKISGDNDTSGYIAGSPSFNYVPLTSQVEVIFPKKVPYDNPNYDVPDFSEVSIFGAHTAQANENDLSWTNNPDLFNFDIFVIKPSSESNDGYFKLVTTIGGVTSSLTTSYYNELYENEKWNLAVRIYQNKYGFSDTVAGTTTSDYTLEFIGYNSLLDNVQNEFKLTLNISESYGKQAMQANKRFYAGALYTDFSTGSVQLARSDVKISSLRVWADYLTDSELKVHSYDAGNIGRQFPNWDPKTILGEDYIATKIDTLALNWDFFNVTSSDGNGQFIVQDASSGSYDLATNSGYGSFGLVSKIRHTGFGENFYPDDLQVVNKEYVFSARQAPPETVLGSDMIQTPITDDVNRPKAVRPLNFFLSVEKSMSQVINDEIMNWFATIKDFNNLIGEPVERYRAEYRNLEHLRKLFFNKVNSEPDFEKFLEFYKWIDSSISMMMSQLLPMSADASNKVRNVVESHILERNKYENKAPILFKGDDIVSTISTALNYSYEQQKSETGALWLKQRAERSGSTYVGTPLEPYNDIDREVIRQIVNSKNLNKSPVLYDVTNSRYYDGKKDQNRIFSQQYRLLTDKMTIVEDTISSPLISNKQFTGVLESAESLVNSSSNEIVSRFYKRQGNYQRPYEYLQMVGRTANNKSFVDLTGSITTVSSSLSGVVDRTLPIRNAYKSVIVERFSAPGGPEVLSRGALDNAAEEYSAYNDLNSRNMRVRKQLRSWLAESASYDSVNPSIHKVNKNVARRPTDETGNNFVAKYDNDFVTHQIPQSDAQYYWISSSLQNKPNTSGFTGPYLNLNSYNTSSFQLLSGGVIVYDVVNYQATNGNNSYPNQFGYSVAMNSVGNKFIVGTPVFPNNSFIQGYAAIFSYNNNIIENEEYLYRSTTIETADYFGHCVAMNSIGSKVAVGAPIDEIDAGLNPNIGLIFIFNSSSSGWIEEKILTGSLSGLNDRFGWSIAMDSNGSKLAAGAIFDEMPTSSSTGLVYMFNSSSLGWHEESILSGSFAINNSDRFGQSVAMNSTGNRIIVGASNDENDAFTDSGLAYIFSSGSSGWIQESILQSIFNKYYYDSFGYSVTINSAGDKVFIGAINAETEYGFLANKGLVFVFSSGSSGWIQEVVLTSSLLSSADNFGFSLSANSAGDKLIVGVPNDETGSTSNTGTAFIFNSSSTGWTQTLLLSSSNDPIVAIDDKFGYSVAMNSTGDKILVGAINDELQGNLDDATYNDTGLVYYFDISKNYIYNDFLGLNRTIDRSLDITNNLISTGSNFNSELNNYLNNNNGPYGYPSWKQIRKDNNKIVQLSRKDNNIIVQDTPTLKTKVENGYKVQYSERRAQTFTSYKQPPVTFNKPMKHSLFVTGSEDPIDLISTYDNNRERFSNEDLARATGIFDRTDPQAHDVLVALDNGAIDPKPELYKVEYDSQLYPSDKYTGLSDVRLRSNYEDWYNNTSSIIDVKTYWRDDINERSRLSINNDLYNYNDTSYQILPVKKPLIIYNDEINYDVNFLSGSNNTKESIYGLDYKTFFNSSSNYTSTFNGNLYIKNILGYKDGEFISLGGGITLGTINNIGGIFSILSTSIGLYAGGYIGNIDSVKSNPLFFWNGNKWSTVGTGSGPRALIANQTSILDIVSNSSGLYVAGNFRFVDSIPSKYVARWNGNSWSSTGTTLGASIPEDDSLVKALAVSGNTGLYAGGGFPAVSFPGSAGIALSSSSGWQNVGGMNSFQDVLSIVTGSGRLFIGGTFAPPLSSFNIVAQYEPSSGWQQMGNGLGLSDYGGTGGNISSMVSGADGIYVLGYFDRPRTISSPTYYGSAKWNGTSWEVLYGNMQNPWFSGVPPSKIFSGSSGIYAAKEKDVYKLNVATKTWELFFNSSGRLNGLIRTVSSGSDGLYFSGDLSSPNMDNQDKNFIYEKNIKGNLTTDNLVKSVYNIQNNISIPLDKVSIFDIAQNNIYAINEKQKYIKLTEEVDYGYLGFNPSINCSFSSSDGLFIGGHFSASSDISNNAINFVKWNGVSYQSFNLSLANITDNLEVINSAISASDGIYIGGYFNNPGYSLAKWNGTNWVDAWSGDTEAPLEISKIVSGSNGLYVCGLIFGSMGGDTLGIVRNGAALSGLTVGVDITTAAEGRVLDMYSASNGIYYVGKFNGYGTNFIGFYNGSATINLGTGLDDYGYSVYSGSDGVYAGGNFIRAGGVEVNYIAKWNGSIWSSLAGGLNGRVLTIASHSSGLYVGGEFTADNSGNSLNNIARWNGSSWERLGSNSNSNGYGIYDGTYVKNISILPNNKLLIVGKVLGTRSGATIKDKNFNYSVQGYNVGGAQIIPTPQLTFNNFIPPSSGSLSGMKIIETSYNSSNRLLSTTDYTSSERINIINENYRYEIENKSGKTPFFNSYADYLGGIKSISVSHSLAPEYTISEHIKTYVTERNGDFSRHLDEDYLKLNGAAQEEGYENINSSINTTNNLKPELIFGNSKNNENVNLNLKISGIKKLLPYRDFYPSERIIKLGSYFINSFLDLQTNLTSVLNQDEIYSSSLSNGTPINQQILALLQPMMAPGILLNTIKSSIAVDWPAFITKSVSYDTFSKPVFYAETGSNLITKKVINPVTNIFSNYTASNFIDKEFNYRFPFESIIEFDTRIPQELKTGENNLYYLNPTHYSSDAITGSDYGLFVYPSYNMDSGSLKSFSFRDSNYKLSIHNFLAEIPNFFLNGKLSNIISAPESKFETARAGVTYYMDVVLEKDSKYKEFVADPYHEGLKIQASRFSDGTLLLPSPDSLYGPPTRYWNNVNAAAFFARSPYNFYSKLLDTPAYAPYVPPYYYGKAIARISFTPTDSRKYSLSEIQKLCTVEYINTDADNLFARRSSFISGNFSSTYGDNYSSSPAYKQMMKLSSSVNLFLATDTKLTKQDPKTGETFEVGDRETKDESWVIQTKFETPSINFIDADLSDNIGLKFVGGTKESGSVKGVYSYMMKGLWTTYGRPVENGSGIKLYLQQSYEKFNENLTGSLIDLCGFRSVLDQKKTIGLLAERKRISEGVVIIPYTYNKNHGIGKEEVHAETLKEILGENGIYSASQTGNGPYYYKIDKRIISRYLGGLNFDNASFEQIKKAAESSEYQGNSIIKLINSMTKYVIPPHLDWLRNKNITPFVMYIADFSTEFDKQDLSDIWQGVMPKQSYKAELDEVSINHKFEVGEVFHGKRPQNDTKFKVFKVKQRANINYYKLTDDSKDDDRFKFTFGNSQQAVVPDYSYNWPYDFFSLVELVNIEASLKVDNYPQTTVARENEERRRILNTVVADLGPLKREDVKELASMKELAKKDKVKAKEEKLSPKLDKKDLPNPLTDPKPKKGKKKRGD